MSLVLCGAHRSGKSTTAKRVIELAKNDVQIVFLPSPASGVFERLGFDVRATLSFEDRLTVQEAILNQHVCDMDNSGYPWISDRSTLDMAAYAIAEWGKNAPTLADQERLLRYIDRCFKIANAYYSTLVLVQPGIPHVDEPNKPAPNAAYQETLNFLLRAMLRDDRLLVSSFMLPRETTDLDRRADSVLRAYYFVINGLRTERERRMMNLH